MIEFSGRSIGIILVGSTLGSLGVMLTVSACEPDAPTSAAESTEIEGEWVDLGHDVEVRTFEVDGQKCVVVTEDVSDSVAISCNWGVTTPAIVERPDSL